MKIIKPSFEILIQENGLEGVYKQIETAGRTCYASTPIEGKAEDFVNRMIKSEHFAMLEHGTIYLYLDPSCPITGHKYRDNPYSKYVEIRLTKEPNVHRYITTNLRVMVENGWLEDLQYICEPTIYHEKRVTVKFITQISITREFNRHRVNSMAEQSTRFCNYSKDKHGNEIGINMPNWVLDENPNIQEHSDYNSKTLLEAQCETITMGDDFTTWSSIDYWLFANRVSEYCYMNLLRLGKKPEEARSVLPLDTNTELIHTAFVSDWKHFFDLRALGTTGKPHPDAKILAEPLMQEFINLKLITI